jgi:CRP-like cAMP-binding protein
METQTKGNSTGNALLDCMPQTHFNRLRTSLEPVALPNGEKIYREGGPISHAYFPVDGVLSAVISLPEGRIVEAATIGNEGMGGLHAFLGLEFNPILVTSQVPGKSFRIPISEFLAAIEPGDELDRLMRRYAAYSLRYANQTIACNAMHSIEERACRWLLMASDRAGKNEFSLTHEFLAEMLGVRRQSITVVAGLLQSAGLINYRRGVIRIIDREGLEAASCECYHICRREYQRILGCPEPTAPRLGLGNGG